MNAELRSGKYGDYVHIVMPNRGLKFIEPQNLSEMELKIIGFLMDSLYFCVTCGRDSRNNIYVDVLNPTFPYYDETTSKRMLYAFVSRPELVWYSSNFKKYAEIIDEIERSNVRYIMRRVKQKKSKHAI